MDGLRIFESGVVACILAFCPVQMQQTVFNKTNNTGGGIPVAMLVHGGPAPVAISSALPWANCTADMHSTTALQPNTAGMIATNFAPPNWKWQSTIEPDANNFDWKFGAAVSIFERTIAIGPARNWDLGLDQGGVQLFTLSGPHWSQSAAISHPFNNPHAQFGGAISLIHKLLLVGCPRDSEVEFESGAAFLYRQVGSQWQLESTLRRSTGAAADLFGAAVACDEHTLVIGAPKADQGVIDSGAVEVFERTSDGWSNVATLVSNPPTAGALFGLSVAIDAGRIIVGAPGDRTDGTMSGRAFVFTRQSSGWVLDASLSCPAGTRGWFGSAVAASQGRVLIGAPRLVRPNQTDFDARGSAFEFRRASDGWQLAASIMPSNMQDGDSFGCSLALYRDRAVFGASSDSAAGRLAGAAFAGSRNLQGQWCVEKLFAPDSASQQLVGHMVSIHGQRIAVGRLGNQEEDPVAGAVSVFMITPTQITQKITPDLSPSRGVADP